MNIYTSNFASAHRFDSSKYCLVSISRFAPKGWEGFQMSAFAPSARLLRGFTSGALNEAGYTACYLDYLDSINVRSFFQVIAKWAEGRDIVLLCYEKAGAFCHRRLLASWVLRHYGYNIKEFSFNR